MAQGSWMRVRAWRARPLPSPGAPHPPATPQTPPAPMGTARRLEPWTMNNCSIRRSTIFNSFIFSKTVRPNERPNAKPNIIWDLANEGRERIQHKWGSAQASGKFLRNPKGFVLLNWKYQGWHCMSCLRLGFHIHWGRMDQTDLDHFPARVFSIFMMFKVRFCFYVDALTPLKCKKGVFQRLPDFVDLNKKCF